MRTPTIRLRNGETLIRDRVETLRNKAAQIGEMLLQLKNLAHKTGLNKILGRLLEDLELANLTSIEDDQNQIENYLRAEPLTQELLRDLMSKVDSVHNKIKVLDEVLPIVSFTLLHAADEQAKTTLSNVNKLHTCLLYTSPSPRDRG